MRKYDARISVALLESSEAEQLIRSQLIDACRVRSANVVILCRRRDARLLCGDCTQLYSTGGHVLFVVVRR
jgi:hypothetical protein